MKSKLLLVVAALAAVALAAYAVLSRDSNASAEPPAGRAGGTGAPIVRSAGSGAEPAGGAPLVEAPGEAASASARRALEPETPEEPPVATWDAAETLWVDLQVELPKGTPSGERAFVVGLETEAAPDDLHGEDGPFGALFDGREPRRIDGVIASAECDADGAARLALPPGTTECRVAVGGTWVHSLEPRVLSEAEFGAVVTLRPVLGAVVEGRATGPDRGPVTGVEVTLSRSINTAAALGNAGDALRERKARTGTDGRFILRAVPAGQTLRLATEAEGFARAFSDDVKTKPGERESVAFALQSGSTLRGRVVDGAGSPVAQVEIRALGQEFFGSPTERLGDAESDADGRFEIVHVTPGKVWLRAKREGFQDLLSKPFEPSAGEALEVPDLVLGSGLAVAGRVTFPDGSPAKGARIEVDPDFSENLAGTPANPRAYSGADTTATSGDDGTFQLVGLGEGPWVLTAEVDVEGDGAAPRTAGRWTAEVSTVRPPATDVALTLEAPVVVTGTVVDERGAPVATEFTIEGERSGSQWYMPASETRTEAFESEDGGFTLDRLRSGDWSFTARADGFARSEPVSVRLPDAAPLGFVLERPVTLAGRVIDPTGAPVAGAEIAKELDMAESVAAMQGRSDWPKATSDEEGLFLLEGVAPGSGSIHAKKAGWAASESYGYELGSGESVDEIVLVLRTGGTVTGQIYTADGSPAAGCMVIVQVATVQERRMTNADSEGRFVETHLTPGTWQIQAFPGMESLQSEETGAVDQAALLKALKMTSVKIDDGEEKHVVLGSPPASPVRIEGRVTVGGEPLSGLMVSFLPSTGGALERLKIETTDDGGRFATTVDEPGEYRVTVQSTSSSGQQNSVEFVRRVPEVTEHRIDIAMPRGRITGRVAGPDGKPVGEARVSLTMQSGHAFGTMLGGQYNETTTHEDGRYEILFVREGSYAVAAGGEALGGLLGGSNALGRRVKSVDLKEDAHATVDFELEKPGALRGIVRDASGSPVANASVFVRDEEGRLLELFSFQSTNASGRYEASALAPGEYTVTARTETQASSGAETVLIRSGEVTEAELVVDTGTMLEVTLTDRSGKDVRARVSVVDERGHEMNGMIGLGELMERLNGPSDSAAQRVGPLPPGRYEVRALAEDGRSTDWKVKLTGQPVKKVRLKLD